MLQVSPGLQRWYRHPEVADLARRQTGSSIALRDAVLPDPGHSSAGSERSAVGLQLPVAVPACRQRSSGPGAKVAVGS